MKTNQRAYGEVGLGGVQGGIGSAWATRTLVSRLHEGVAPDRHMSHVKGVLGERMMDRLIGRSILERTRWSAATPVGSPHGIDGLFFKLDRSGNPRDMLIAEAKVYTAALGTGAKMGDQMTTNWIGHYLRRSATTYGELARALGAGGAVRAATSEAGRQAIRIPLANGASATVWRRGDTVQWSSGDPAVTQDDVRRQLRNMATWMEKGASGDVRFRARVFKYDVVDGEHRFTISTINPETLELMDAKQFIGKFGNLPPHHRDALRASFEEAFRILGKGDDEIAELVQKACDDPDFAYRMTRRARWKLRIVRGTELATVAAFSGGIALAMNALSQWYFTGEVDWRHASKVGVIYGVGATVGTAFGSHAAAAMLATKAGRAILSVLPGRTPAYWGRALGSSVGGLASLAFVLTTQVALGMIDRETAYRQLAAAGASSLAAAGATGGAFAAAAAFGMAGTGTAIGSLSGAAFTNAALAWMGGGPLYAGGGGMVLGGAVLTGGVLVVAMGVGLAVNWGYSQLDESRTRLMIVGRLMIAGDRVGQGRQLEWDRPAYG